MKMGWEGKIEIKKVVIIILSNNFYWTIVRLHIGSVALLHRGHPEIKCPSLSLFQLFQLFPFSYRAGKHFRIHGICCWEGEKFSLFKVQNHRIAQFGRELGENHFVSSEFRWDYLAPRPNLKNLQWEKLYHVPGEQIKLEEISSFPQLWNVGVNTLRKAVWEKFFLSYLVTFYIQTRQQATRKFV